MKTKTPASGKRQGLDNNDFCKSDSSTKPNILNTTPNGRRVLERLARKWVSRGYYPTPSAAMRVLLGEVNHG